MSDQTPLTRCPVCDTTLMVYGCRHHPPTPFPTPTRAPAADAMLAREVVRLTPTPHPRETPTPLTRLRAVVGRFVR